jgi:hypothetical protein
MIEVLELPVVTRESQPVLVRPIFPTGTTTVKSSLPSGITPVTLGPITGGATIVSVSAPAASTPATAVTTAPLGPGILVSNPLIDRNPDPSPGQQGGGGGVLPPPPDITRSAQIVEAAKKLQQQKSEGMSTVTKVAIGAGVVGAGGLLWALLRRRR